MLMRSWLQQGILLLISNPKVRTLMKNWVKSKISFVSIMILLFRFVKCEKCSHFFVVLSDADAKNRQMKGQMGVDGPEIQNAQQGKYRHQTTTT